MTQFLIDQAIELMKAQRFAEALDLLGRVIDKEPSHWNAWYMAGQCCRLQNDTDGAIRHLSRAAELKRDAPSILLALGIAYQLKAQWESAIDSFRRAIEIDSDFDLAYNSLALTQKKCGELDNALHNYDAGAKALARRIVKTLQNSPTSPIHKHRDTAGTLWVECATYAALFLSSSAEGIHSIAWPTGAQALDQERTEKHAGLYWMDVTHDKGETMRMFLPNYFNTFWELLKCDAAYSNPIGNRGIVLELLRRHGEARQHFDEAAEFQP